MKTAFLLLLLPLATRAQAPVLTAAAPARHAVAVPRTGPLRLSFSGPVVGAADLRLHGSLWSGRLTGPASGDGTPTLSVLPARAFAPGEPVSLSMPATVRSPAGVPAATGQVVQFRAAAGPAQGTFTAGSLAGPVLPDGLAEAPILADFTNDGKLDLLVNTDHISLYTGNGRGTFATAAYAAPFGNYVIRTAKVADFNEDGNLDVLVKSGGDSVRVGLGNGRGELRALPGLSLGSHQSNSWQHLATGDFNADGHVDFVACFQRLVQGQPRYGLLTQLGDGQGSFTAGSFTPLAMPYEPDLQVADVNNDGKLDVVLVSDVNHSPNYYYSLEAESYLGDGQGGLVANGPPTTLLPVGPDQTINEFQLADLNADGNLDLLLLGKNAVLQLRPGNGNGAFGAPITLPNPPNVFPFPYFKVADVDGDGDLDVLATGIRTTGATYPSVMIQWRNNGTGSFAAPTFFLMQCYRLGVGDLDNDGTLDLACSYYDNDTGNGNVIIRLNQPLANAPTLSSFTPGMGSVGSTVTLTGTNFTGATTVLLGGVPVSGFTVVNGNTIVFPLPVGSTGGLITVITPSGQATSTQALQVLTAVRAGASALPVQLYPNPARGTVQVLLPAGSAPGPLQAAFYNALGQAVRRQTTVPTGRTAALDLRGLAPGLYTLRLQAGPHTAIQQLVVE